MRFPANKPTQKRATRTARNKTRRTAAALMYLSGVRAPQLAQELGVSKKTVARMILAALQDAALHHGRVPPSRLRGLGPEWFRLIASMPEAG